MKKIIILAIAVLLVAGTAWAQFPPGFAPPGKPDLPNAFDPDHDDYDAPKLGDMFGRFSAVKTESVESRTSFGIFGSMVDDYIGVNSYDADIGTFAFLGGFDGDVISEEEVSFSLGVAKTMNFGYMAFYYGGRVVDARGTKSTNFQEEGDPDGTKDTVTKRSTAQWENSLAVLLGTSNIGAFRLDFIFDLESDRRTIEGTPVAELKDSFQGYPANNVSIAATWGGIDFFGFDPYITLGFKVPGGYSMERAHDVAGSIKTSELKYRQNGAIGLQTGVFHGATGLFGDIAFLYGLGTKYEHINNSTDTQVTTEVKGSSAIDFALRVGYFNNSFDVGKFSFGVCPLVAAGFGSQSRNTTTSISPKPDPAPVDQSMASDRWFEVSGDIDLGMRFKINEKFALYTGTSLSLFDYASVREKGGEKKSGNQDETRADEKSWTFRGISWDDTDGGNLRFGLTFTPVQGFVIGAGIDTSSYFRANLADMETSLRISDMFETIFEEVKFNITASIQIPSGNRSSNGSGSDE